MQSKSMLLLLALLVLLNGSLATAEQPLATIEAFASKEILAVAYVDLESVNLDACVDWVADQEIVDPDVAEEMKMMSGMGQRLLDGATKAGADHVIVLVHPDDLLMQGPPLLVFSVAEGGQAHKTYKSLRRVLGLMQIPDFKLELWNGAIMGGTEKQIERTKTELSVWRPRPRLVKAWSKFGGRDAGLMIVGNKDTRRAIREMFPKLEAPFENLTGKMLADGIESLGLSVKLPKEVDGKIVVRTVDQGTAETLKAATVELIKLITDRESEYADMFPSSVLAALAELNPQVESNDVVIDLKPILKDKVKLQELLEPIASGSRHTRRLNDLRQIILAMLNYESAHKTLPAYANFDKDGKPLLSWRVHVLPFLECGELYNQFKLDEPWDCPHNIKLVERMPAIFADPSRKLAVLNKAGKTRIVVPRAAGTMFHSKEGTTFKTITDGSSNTIAIVSVIPEEAVIWTKPSDWEVDLENPKKGLFSKEIEVAVVARADGSPHTLSADMMNASLKALLTKSGGEVVK